MFSILLVGTSNNECDHTRVKGSDLWSAGHYKSLDAKRVNRSSQKPCIVRCELIFASQLPLRLNWPYSWVFFIMSGPFYRDAPSFDNQATITFGFCTENVEGILYYRVQKNRHLFLVERGFGWQLWMFSWRGDRYACVTLRYAVSDQSRLSSLPLLENKSRAANLILSRWKEGTVSFAHDVRP